MPRLLITWFDSPRTVQVRELVMAAYERAKGILRQHEGQLHQLAKALLERETLTGEQIRSLLGMAAPERPRLADVVATDA